MVTEQRIEQIDPVTLSVINNAFVNVCREMGTAMMRTSYSPIFNEGLDFSCMLFNLRGDLIGQAEFCPTMLGSCQYAMKWMLDEVGLNAFGPGNVFIHNDPYRGQCHMPEHLVVKAVYHEGKPWGFVGNIAHVGEIGGMAPGSFAADRGNNSYHELKRAFTGSTTTRNSRSYLVANRLSGYRAIITLSISARAAALDCSRSPARSVPAVSPSHAASAFEALAAAPSISSAPIR